MSPSPRIGRSEKSEQAPIGTVSIGGSEKPEKSEVLKLADDLAAKSRILRKQAESQNAILDRLRRIGEGIAYERDEQSREVRTEETTELRSLIEKADALYRDGAEAANAAAPVLASLNIDGTHWDSLFNKLPVAHGLTLKTAEEREANPGSAYYADTTRNRIARLHAVAKELKEYINAMGNKSELRSRIEFAENVLHSISPEAQLSDESKETQRGNVRYAVEALRTGIERGSVGDAIRGKLDGAKKLLAEIGEAIAENPITVETDSEEKRA